MSYLTLDKNIVVFLSQQQMVSLSKCNGSIFNNIRFTPHIHYIYIPFTIHSINPVLSSLCKNTTRNKVNLSWKTLNRVQLNIFRDFSQ